jgi:hypothetical protein
MRRGFIISLFALLSTGIAHGQYFNGFKTISDNPAFVGLDKWSYSGSLVSFRGLNTTISSASPPGILVATPTSGTEPFFVTPSANTTYTGPYGLYGAPEVTNIVRRASYETCSSGNPVGWTLNQFYGDIDCSTTHKAKAAKSASMYTTGSYVIMVQCHEIDKNKSYLASLYAYGDPLNEGLTYYSAQYSNADCTGTFLGFKMVLGGIDAPVGWTSYGAVMSGFDPSALSLLTRISTAPPSDTVMPYVDEVNIIESITGYDATCTCDTDASCACSAIIASIPTVIDHEDWEIRATIRSPVDGAVASPVRRVMFTPATSGTNNQISINWSSDTLTFKVWDYSGVAKIAVVNASGDAETSYNFKAYHKKTGEIGVCWDGVCGAEVSGAIMDGVNATTYIASDGSVGGNIHIKDLEYYETVSE